MSGTEDVGGYIYHLLSRAAAAPKRDVDAMLEAGFQQVAKLRALPVNARLSASWRIAELGGLKLLAAFVQPGSPAVALALTLLGVMLQDTNVLSHKLGTMALANPALLPALDRLLVPTAEHGPQMPMLASQVLNNIVKSADAPAIAKVMAAGDITDRLLAVLAPLIAEEIKTDWRHGFVVVEVLLSFQIASPADANTRRVGETVARLLAARLAELEKLHRAYLQRCLACTLVWTSSKATLDDPALEPLFADLAKALQGPGAPSRQGTATLSQVLASKDPGGSAEDVAAISTRVRDWKQIEADAQEYVRSPEFKQGPPPGARSGGAEAAPSPAADLKGNGNAFFQLGRYADAIAEYSTALALCTAGDCAADPEHEKLQAVLYCNRAECRLRTGSPEEALKDSESALALNPDLPKALFRQAKAAAALNRSDTALASLAHLLSIEPENRAAAALRSQLTPESDGND